MAEHPLELPVARFVEVVGPLLTEVANDGAGRVNDPLLLRVNAAIEALNIASAAAASDRLLSDNEIEAIVHAFDDHLDLPELRGELDEVRTSEFMRPAEWLEAPPPIFDIFLAADREDAGTRSWEYYRHALHIAHTVASLDMHPSRVELDVIERFRSLMLKAMAENGVQRPGRSVPTRPVSRVRRRDLENRRVIGGDDTEGPQDVDQDGADEPGDPGEPEPIEDLLQELDSLIGLDSVKREVHLVTSLLRVQQLRADRGLPVPDTTRHMVFTGNPGTGKTTVARLVARIYRSLGVVEQGHLVETDRSGLVVGYIGQTAPRVAEVCGEAMGGVLLIDEAYSLVRGGEKDFGREAIDTLVKQMEDHRDDFVIIVAGYPDEMREFVASNPGLRSRFSRTIHFPDYSTDELLAIFELISDKHRYHLNDASRAKVRVYFDAQHRDKGFGNGRLSRNLFEEAVARHAARVVGDPDLTDDELTALTVDDIPDP